MAKGMILAAGQGTRVRPLTKDLPKPMVPILGKPVMEYLIEHMARHGITEIMVNVAFHHQRIEQYFARHNIKPGITGLAQVRGYRGETREIHEMIQRVESDIEYINNWSIWLDLIILFRTIGAFVGSKAY